MKLFIDADGCPVTDIAVGLANTYHIPCVIVCDTAHEINRDGAQTVTVGKGADSADFALVNLLQPGDIVVTQDYGLAAMCLSRRAAAIHQDGFLYTQENIDELLFFRAAATRARRGGVRTKGPAKRTQGQNEQFYAALDALLRRSIP